MTAFTRAKREAIPLLIGIAGGTGSGKTYSALRLAKGLAGDKPFAIIDTEAGRAKHYADLFAFDHLDLAPPFRPERYEEAILAAQESGYPVIVVDSFSHEYAGEGGLLDWHEEELTRMAGQDWKKREALTFAAWVKPKMAHKAFVSRLLQLRTHLIVCLRAEEKIEIVKEDGRTKVVPKRTLSGHVGWIPIAEKSFAYELTLSLVMTPDAPGIPKPIKLQEQHRPFVPLDQPLSEDVGRLLADWARGKSSGAESVATAHPAAGATEGAPSASDDPGASPPPPAADAAAASQDPFADDMHALNALVGSMREAGAITTRNLWTAVAGMRGLKPDEATGTSATDILIGLLDGVGEDGELHWTPLRESLTPEEAKELRSRLGRKWAAAQEAVPA